MIVMVRMAWNASPERVLKTLLFTGSLIARDI